VARRFQGFGGGRFFLLTILVYEGGAAPAQTNAASGSKVSGSRKEREKSRVSWKGVNGREIFQKIRQAFGSFERFVRIIRGNDRSISGARRHGRARSGGDRFERRFLRPTGDLTHSIGRTANQT